MSGLPSLLSPSSIEQVDCYYSLHDLRKYIEFEYYCSRASEIHAPIIHSEIMLYDVCHCQPPLVVNLFLGIHYLNVILPWQNLMRLLCF